MAAVHDASVSLNHLRLTTPPTSMADSLPSINFGFDELRETMARFTVRFDRFIEEGRKRVLEERNQFRINLAELQEDQRTKHRTLETLALKSSTHATVLQKEALETAEMQSAITTLTTQRDASLTHHDALLSQLNLLQKDLSTRRSAIASHTKYLNTQSTYNEPELAFWTEHLGLRIEGAGQPERLRFVFSCVDEGEWERECWFELELGGREYEVGAMKPRVERGEWEGCLDELNRGRDLKSFLRGMRGVFVRALKG